MNPEPASFDRQYREALNQRAANAAKILKRISRDGAAVHQANNLICRLNWSQTTEDTQYIQRALADADWFIIDYFQKKY